MRSRMYLWGYRDQGQILVLPVPSCVILDKYLTSLILLFLFCEAILMEINSQTRPED